MVDYIFYEDLDKKHHYGIITKTMQYEKICQNIFGSTTIEDYDFTIMPNDPRYGWGLTFDKLLIMDDIFDRGTSAHQKAKIARKICEDFKQQNFEIIKGIRSMK